MIPAPATRAGVGASARPGGAIVPGWLLLAFDGVKLAVPRREASLITLATELRPTGRGTPAGWLATDNGELAVYALDARIEALDRIPESYHFCVALREGAHLRGLLCETVTLLHADDDLAMQRIPAGLYAPRAPLAGIALLNTELVNVAHAGDLIAWLPQPERTYDA